MANFCEKLCDLNCEYIDVTHSIGVPFGAMGTGYGVFGKFGFIRPNFNSTPNKEMYKNINLLKEYDYLNVHEEYKTNFASITMSVNGVKYAFQGEKLDNTTEIVASDFKSFSFLPFSKHFMKFNDLNIDAEIFCYSPIIPYDLKESSTPASVFELTIKNYSGKTISGEMECLVKSNDETGLKLCFEEGEKIFFSIENNESFTTRVFIAWYYPIFYTPSPILTEEYKRYYTLNFTGVDDVVKYAVLNCEKWKKAINEWHDSLDVPAPFKRLWFSSLSSVITSTMMSTEPYFFEIEMPHKWINTMDVTIYSSWLYMIYWPEIEVMDMYCYKKAIQTDGENKGLVWHSLWSDGAHYVEEPCYITRIYRDYLWYNDKKFLFDMREPLQNAVDRVYKDVFDGLIESLHGNQSYDVWKMPGVSAYVNMPWLYALYSLDKINQILGVNITVNGNSVKDMLKKAVDSFVKYLWNEEEGYFNAFYRTPNAEKLSIEDTVFSDQLFGRWLLLIERELSSLVPMEMVEKSLKYVYVNNLIDDKENGFRGWANGMLKNRVPCCDNEQYHVKTCWFGAQLDLGSLLGELGYEKESLDVFYSIESSLQNNHLAVGEWNKSVNESGLSEVLAQEVAKDTPRFPSYPRYKCSWEYLVRILGIKLNEKVIELKPFKSFDFSIKNIILAGCKLSIKVEKDWNTIIVDGNEQKHAVGDRNNAHSFYFAKK